MITNPVYTMIISCNSVNSDNKKTNSSPDIQKFLLEKIKSMESSIRDLKFYSPDIIIAGNSNTAICGHRHYDNNDNLMDEMEITKFFTGKELACYQVKTCDNLAYGLAVSHLMMALNFIKLGLMPWEMIFNTANIPDPIQRDGTLTKINQL